MPSLAQLDQAVREFIAENPTDVVTVVVDASFGHRIDPSEVSAFEEAEEAGEVISPPAGAIGRGDAFLLRIAEKTGATVLSNDSFQEFHVEHTWLFDKGRLVGGKPVPGVGWIFMDRSPVRGAKSREVTKEAKRKKRETEATPTRGAAAAGKPAASAALAGSAVSAVSAAGRLASSEGKVKTRSKSVDRAIARATEEVVGQRDGSKSRRRRGSSPPAEPVNEPLAFITFIAAHPLGSDVVGTVLEYSSHGAFVEADGARCYIPLSAMADPAPRRAREVVTKGEPCTFVVQAFDPQRRGIELALPGFARVAGEPTAETVEAEISGDKERLPDEPKPRGRSRSGSGRRGRPEGESEAAAASAGVEAPQAETAPPAAEKTRRRGPAKKVASVAAAAAGAAAEGTAEGAAGEDGGDGAPSGVTKKAAAKKAAAGAKKAPAARKAPAAKKAVGAEEPAGAAGAEKAAGGEKAPATKKAAASAAKSAPAAKKAAGAKKAPAKKTAGTKKAAGAAKKAVAGDGATARSTPAKAGAAKKAAKKVAASPAVKAPAGKVAVSSPEKAAARKTAAKKAAPPLRPDPP